MTIPTRRVTSREPSSSKAEETVESLRTQMRRRELERELEYTQLEAKLRQTREQYLVFRVKLLNVRLTPNNHIVFHVTC